MAVRQEIKSQLAKLLATEDLIVEHKKVPSAQFNVRTRVLILPLWEKASSEVYDMLVGHEVGHALFTPDEDWWLEHDIPQPFVNVVEDARIEKLMKRKYMGLAKSFYKGYSELHDKDFFEVDGEDLSDFNLADRANLYFKIGSLLSISFSSTEKPIIDLIQNAETFTDTIAAAEALYNFCKQEEEEDSQEMAVEAKQDALTDLENSGNFGINDAGDNTSPISDTDRNSDVEDRSDSIDSSSGMDDLGDSLEPEVRTADALESKLKDLINSDGVENEYIEVPTVNLDTIIASYEDVHKEIDACYGYQQMKRDTRQVDGVLPELLYLYPEDLFGEVDGDFHKFKKDAQKEVNYLVKEFECRKSASAYARATTNRTGVLDTTKLQTYRFNEDLFKKVSVIPDGKNHGLVFVLDWSGSMQYVLEDTLKQLYNLIWFCRKVQIPFEVYAFTNEWRRRGEYDWENGNQYVTKLTPHYEAKQGLFAVEDEFSLMNLFSSKTNAATLQHQMINIWRIASAFGRSFGVHYQNPHRLTLSGTPLNEALISLHQILPRFQKENGVEKVQCIVLTDGEANSIPYHKEVQRHWEDKPYLGTRNPNPNHTFLRDKKIGRVYKFGYRWHEFTDVIIKNLKDKFPSTNFIGIRVLANRDAKSFIRMHQGEDEKLMSDWRKNKSFCIKESGYDAYFGLSANSLSQDTEFDVDQGATKARIKSAFVKSLKTKKLNKKVLSEFIELVA